MELPDAIAQVLDVAVPQTHELTQLERRAIRQCGRRRSLFGSKLRDAERIHRVRLGAGHVDLREPACLQRIEQRYGKTGCDQRRKQILPIVTGCLERNQGTLSGADQFQELLVAGHVFCEPCGLHQHGAFGVDDRHHVFLRCDVDSDEFHAPLRRGNHVRGASKPMLMLLLVDARTSLW